MEDGVYRRFLGIARVNLIFFSMLSLCRDLSSKRYYICYGLKILQVEPGTTMKQHTILVVDDEESLRDICREVLERAGYRVLPAESGRQALAILTDQDVDLVLTDLRMPEMGGLELLQSAKERNIDVEFLVMTGFGTIETAIETMKRGAVDYLPKPFNIKHLLIKVEKCLRDREARTERRELTTLVRMLNLSNALNLQLDLGSLVREFLVQVEENFAPDSVLLFLPEIFADRQVPYAVRGGLIRTRRRLLPWIEMLCKEVVRKGTSKIVDKYVLGDDPSLVVSSNEERKYSVVIAPLVLPFRTIGAIALIRETEEDLYQVSELQLLSVFASHVASSIQNAHMYGKMRDLNMDVIRSYSRAVEAKDIYTRGHSELVARYARKLGRRLGLNGQELDNLYMAGILHDIGKIGIPDNILNKPSLLTGEEYEVMKTHPAVGHAILSKIGTLKPILPIVYHHHERFDGKGYPMGLSGEAIPRDARIVAVVDSYEAMTSDRAYREALPLQTVREIFQQGAGKQWDGEMVASWLELLVEEEKKGAASQVAPFNPHPLEDSGLDKGPRP
jgi:response regulator RpfG family c-di-GMP phosphodiesterase